jgi:hypothetical protein
MRHANGVSPTMRTLLRPTISAFGVMALMALGSISGIGPRSAMADAASPTIVASHAALPSDAGSDPSVVLNGSACANTTSCASVGSYQDVDGAQQVLLETLTSGGWVPSEGALPANAGADPEASLKAVACPAPGSCEALGSYIDDEGNQQGLIDTLANGAWTPSQALLPVNAATDPDAQLNAVACSSPTACVGVGSYDANGTDVEQPPLIESLSGGSWSPLEGPLPVGSGSGVLNGLSCPTAGFCVAVGVYTVMTDASGLVNQNSLPLVSTFASGRWTSGEGAIPSDADTSSLDAETVEFLGDSCDPTGLCQAVGAFADGTGGQEALAETLSGGTWIVDAPTLPADADSDGAFAVLRSVSCQTGQPCLAVGSYLEGSGLERALVEKISAGDGTPGTVSLPSDASDDLAASLNGMSCSTSIPTALVPETTTPSTTTPSTTTPSTTTPSTTTSSTTTTTSTSTTTTTSAPETTPSTPASTPTTTNPTATPTTTTTTTPTTPTTAPAPAPAPTAPSCSVVGTYQDQNDLSQGIIGVSDISGSAPD